MISSLIAEDLESCSFWHEHGHKHTFTETDTQTDTHTHTLRQNLSSFFSLSSCGYRLIKHNYYYVNRDYLHATFLHCRGKNK